jgi:predicted phage terminase large subunit-like protein
VPVAAESAVVAFAAGQAVRSVLARRDSALSPGAARTLRPSQVTPAGDWRTWLVLTGRGWGKTLAGTSDLAAYGRAQPGARLAIVAPTYADARDTCVEGASGLLSALAPAEVRTWNRSLGELVMTNGTRVKLFSADEPDRLRGPQHHRAYCDELAAWSYPATWDMLQFGLRLGSDPRAVVTTTPRPTKLVRDLVASPTTHLTTGSTYENLEHLPAAFREQILARYEGTRLGRQEIHGALLVDVPGALWRHESILRAPPPADLVRVVVAVDPAATSSEDADETGIIVAGLGADGRGYVLADRSCRLSPDGWARRVVAAFDEFSADLVVAEVNNGGEMVGATIKTVRRRIPYKAIHASRGKAIRAQPVAALYEQGNVSHGEMFTELEDQLTSWTPESGTSPDRLDALVWAITELLVKDQRQVYVY